MTGPPASAFTRQPGADRGWLSASRPAACHHRVVTTADDRVTPPDEQQPSTDSAAPSHTPPPSAEYFPDDAEKRIGAQVWFDEPNAPDADATSPAPTSGAASTVVVEDGVIGKRLRRPMDLVRLFIALLVMAAIAAIAFFATETTSGLGQDLTEASRRLPDPVVLVLNVIGAIGVLVLPVAAAVDLLVRGRGRQLLDALLALFLAAAALSGMALVVEQYGSARWQIALAGSVNPQDVPFLPLLGGLVAFVTVARLMARAPWNALTGVVVVSLFAVSVITGGTTVAGIGLSLLAGWVVGLAVRYALGTPTTRPSGVQVAHTLAQAGLPVSVLRAKDTTDVGRRYLGVRSPDGEALEVFVLDRDLEGAGLAQALWRSLRLREASGGGFNMRRSLEQRALMSYAAQNAGAPTSQLLAAREIGPDSSLLAYGREEGTPFDELLPDELSDTALDNAWRGVAALRAAGIAHRRLTADHLLLQPEDDVTILAIGQGSIAAGDVALRIDLAEMLCTQALLVGADRAIASARRTIGVDTLSLALPVLQPVALSPTTKRAVRKNKQLLIDLRDQLVEMRPDAEVEHIELERIKPRTLLMIVIGSIAVYVLLSQLAQVNLVDLFANAQWEWLLIALVASIMTYPGAAWSLTGFVPEKLKLIRTIAAQLAGDFATLVAPPTLGAVAINLRYLQKSGVHPALATASIGVSQVAAFLVHILLLLGFGVAAGTQQDFSFEPPRAAVLAVAAALIIIAGAFLLPPVRKLVWDRAGPLLKQVGPRMVTVAQQPWKIVEGVGGMVALNLGYILCLAACVMAFGGELSFAAIAVVYLTGSVVGQAAPTPGGLGAVEAAMAAGLTLAGLDSGLAFSAVLLYRVITFWLPTIPGYFAFNWLQRNNYL